MSRPGAARSLAPAHEVAVMADQQPAAAKPRSRTRLAVQAVPSLVLVVAIFYYRSAASTWARWGPRSGR